MGDEESIARLKAEKLLNGAYELESAADNVRYYREFAPIYDKQFASALSYTYPQVVASEFRERFEGDMPVLDVGCGTGLVAEELRGIGSIDGVDISDDMLSIAEKKCLYRNLYRQDLTLGRGELVAEYGGVVSAGTFTHGHLGPDSIDPLLETGRSGCLYCIGINKEHYENLQFEAEFNRLQNKNCVENFQKIEHSIYGTTEGNHSGDRAVICVFRKSRS